MTTTTIRNKHPKVPPTPAAMAVVREPSPGSRREVAGKSQVDAAMPTDYLGVLSRVPVPPHTVTGTMMQG
jgi:hypothetical protein